MELGSNGIQNKGSGGGAPPSFDVNLVDRFGNDLGTKPVTANASWDLRTLTPFDYADIYLNSLTNPPTGLQLIAVLDFYNNIFATGIAAKATGGFWLIIGGNANDHSWNSRYAFNNEFSGKLTYLGSPTHNANGISTNGTNQLIRTAIMPSNLKLSNKQFSIYKRNQSTAAANTWFSAGDPNNITTSFGLQGYYSNARAYWTADGAGVNFAQTPAGTDGLHSLRRSGTTTANYFIDGSVVASSTSNSVATGQEFVIGGQLSLNQSISLAAAIDCSYIFIGDALTDTEEADHYTIVQALQTALSRQV